MLDSYVLSLWLALALYPRLELTNDMMKLSVCRLHLPPTDNIESPLLLAPLCYKKLIKLSPCIVTMESLSEVTPGCQPEPTN